MHDFRFKWRKIKLCLFLFFLTGCAKHDGSGRIFQCPNQDQNQGSVSSAGTMTATLESLPNGLVQFSIDAQCRKPSDYLICSILIFNDNVPYPTSPIVFQWTRSELCEQYTQTPLVVSGIPCQYSCPGDTCVWATMSCLNTTTGTFLLIDKMPDNVTCTS